jgi:cytochrome b
MADESRHPVPVWDFPTRVFHWTLVVLVAVNLFVVEPRGTTSNFIHFVSGFAILGLLLFRLAWGFVGSAHSRFADFVRGWPAVKSYAARLRRLSPPHFVGHNPLGGWMIMLLLAALTAMILTGLFAASRAAAGPFAHLIPSLLARSIGGIHEVLSNILILLVVVHVLGVVVDWILTRENLVRAMITGRKRLEAAEADKERPLVPSWRAAVIAVFAVAVFGALVIGTDYSATRATLDAPSSTAD